MLQNLISIWWSIFIECTFLILFRKKIINLSVQTGVNTLLQTLQRWIFRNIFHFKNFVQGLIPVPPGPSSDGGSVQQGRWGKCRGASFVWWPCGAPHPCPAGEEHDWSGHLLMGSLPAKLWWWTPFRSRKLKIK